MQTCKISPLCLESIGLLCKHVKACKEQKGKRSYKNTLEKNKKSKIKGKKKEAWVAS